MLRRRTGREGREGRVSFSFYDEIADDGWDVV